jgi:hypothetical protein
MMLSFEIRYLSLNVELDENRWRQASLPVRWGGLGVRGVALLAPSTYLASAASISELTSALLPPRLRDVKVSGIDIALAAWSELATYPSCATSVPDAPASSRQRAWDDLCCKAQTDISISISITPFVTCHMSFTEVMIRRRGAIAS